MDIIKELKSNGYDHPEDLIKAFTVVNGPDFTCSDLLDKYRGQWNSPEEFIKTLTGGWKENPLYKYLDWAVVVKDYMKDFSESNCHYFDK